MKRDFYNVLGVGKSASKEEIKSAYRKKALEWHPDRNKATDAEEKFKEINEAYEILSNDQKKTAYDQFGHAAFDPGSGGFGAGHTYTDRSGPFTYSWSGGNQNPFGQGVDFDFGGFSNPFDIFEQFFGGGGFGGQTRRQRLETYKIQITFLEAALGCQKEVNLGGHKKTIKIPAGIDDGQKMKFTDFILYIDVLPSDIFKRDGNDVIVNQQLSFSQAALGADITVPTLNGSLKVKVKPGTQPGTLVRLRGQGIRDVNGYGVGDLYIRLVVTVPSRLTGRQKDLLKELNLL